MKLEKELYKYFFVLLAFIAIHWVFGGVLPTFLILKVMLTAYAAYIGWRFFKSGGDVDAWADKGVKEETCALWAKVIGLAFFVCACIFPVSLLVTVEETQLMLAQAVSIPAVVVIAMVPMFLGKR